MKKAFRRALVLLHVLTYYALAPLGYTAFLVLSLLPSRDPTRRARRLQAIMRRAFTLMHDSLRLVGLIDFDPRHVEGELPSGPAVLVANHPSLCDITTTMAAFPDVTTAVKPAIFTRFFLRPLLEGARMFEGAQDVLMPGSVIERAAGRLREGFRVFIFPEGTRSPGALPQRFGRSAFELACRQNVPVVPISIICDPLWLSKDRGIFDVHACTTRIRLRVLPAVFPRDHGFSSRRLRDVVETQIRTDLRITLAEAAGGQDGTDAAGSTGISAQAARGRVLGA